MSDQDMERFREVLPVRAGQLHVLKRLVWQSQVPALTPGIGQPFGASSLTNAGLALAQRTASTYG